MGSLDVATLREALSHLHLPNTRLCGRVQGLKQVLRSDLCLRYCDKWDYEESVGVVRRWNLVEE